MTISYTVEADFDRNGSYETDLTGDVENPGSGITIDRGFGKDGIYQISKVSIVLSNRAGTYAFGNSASALYGKLVPGVPIRVKATYSATDYVYWTGYIQRYVVSGVAAGQVPLCTLECSDLADYLAQFTPVNVTLAERTTAAAYTAIAAAAGLSGGDYTFGGLQTLPLHWVRNADALTAMAQVQQSEMGGQWYIDADGVIQGESRASRLGISVDDTWGDSTNIFPSAASVEVSDADLISKASVQAQIFVEDRDEQVIFAFSRNAANPTPDSLAIAAGQTYGPVSLDYPTLVETVAAQESGEDYTFNTAIDGTGTDITSDLTVTMTEQGAGFQLTLKNGNASTGYVTKFEKKGLAHNYVPDRPIFTYSLPISGDKTERGITVQLPFADDSGNARDFAVQLVRTWRYPYPRLKLLFNAGKHADATVAMLSVELGDLIKYKDTSVTTMTRTYSDDWWYVEHIRHVINPSWAGQNFQTEVTMVPSYLFRNLDAIVYDQFDREDTNLCDNPGFETNDDGWTAGGGASISRDTATKRTGAASLEVVAAAQFDSAIFEVEVPASTAVRFGCWVYFASGGNVFVDLSDGIDQDLNGSNFACAAATWTYVYHEGTTDSHTTRFFHVYLNQVGGDTFYIDDVTITAGLGTSTSGHAWAAATGMDIVTNKAVAIDDALNMPNVNLGTGITDQVIEVSLAGIGTGDEVGVVFRYADADNQYRVYLDKGSNEVILEKNVATTVTEISSPAYTVGTTAELRVIIQSTRIRVWVDGLLYIDTTDSGLSAGTKVGLFARNADGTTTFNEFYAQGLTA